MYSLFFDTIAPSSQELEVVLLLNASMILLASSDMFTPLPVHVCATSYQTFLYL
jgi:hypothetical protein